MAEPPAGPAIITAYLVCREARKQSTVLLSGVGGDELFAGYRKHMAHYWAQAYGRVPSAARNAAERALTALPSLRGTPVKGMLRLGKKMAGGECVNPFGRFIANSTYLDEGQKSDLYTSDFASETSAWDPGNQHR